MIYVPRGRIYLYFILFFFEFPKCVLGRGQAEGLRFNLPSLKCEGVLCGGNRSVPSPPLPSPPPPSPPSSFCSPGRSQAIVVVTGVRRAAACWRRTHSLSLSFAPSPSQLKNPTEFHIFSQRAQISAGRTPREEENWHKCCVKTRVKKSLKNNWGS